MSIGQLFPAIAFLVWVGVPAYAAFARGRLYAAFSAVILTFALPGALILHGRLRELFAGDAQFALDVIFAYSMAAAGIQLAHLVRAKLRGPAFR